MTVSTSTPPTPWWKVGPMWLVVGGPSIVVVASFVTLYLAIRTPDPVYVDPPRPGVAAPTPADEHELTPAMQARNHAATGGVAKAAAPLPARP